MFSYVQHKIEIKCAVIYKMNCTYKNIFDAETCISVHQNKIKCNIFKEIKITFQFLCYLVHVVNTLAGFCWVDVDQFDSESG